MTTTLRLVAVVAVASATLVLAQAASVFVGQTYEHGGVRRVFERTVDAAAIPLLKREERVAFEYPVGDQKIKGVAIKDLDDGAAEASITRGGLGFGFVNVKLKSERGSRLKYLVEVYA